MLCIARVHMPPVGIYRQEEGGRKLILRPSGCSVLQLRLQEVDPWPIIAVLDHKDAPKVFSQDFPARLSLHTQDRNNVVGATS